MPNKTHDANVARLARAFSERLIKEIGVRKVRLCVAGDADPDDFCDANMTMDRAFRQVFEREATFTWDVESEHQSDVDLFNHAWAAAAASGFFLSEVK